MTSTDIKNYAIAAFFLILSIGTIIAIHNYRIQAHMFNGSLADISDYVRTEKQALESPKNQEAVEAAIGLGGEGSRTLAEFRKSTIPALTKAGLGLADETVALKNFTDKLSTSLTDEKAGLIPVLASTATKLGVDVDTLNDAIKQASSTSGLAVEEIKRRMADPRFGELLDEAVATGKKTNTLMDHVNDAATEVAATAGNVETASENLPDIAVSLAKIAAASSRYAKAYWLSRIISVFLPLVP